MSEEGTRIRKCGAELGLTVVTRDTGDFEKANIAVFNPSIDEQR